MPTAVTIGDSQGVPPICLVALQDIFAKRKISAAVNLNLS